MINVSERAMTIINSESRTFLSRLLVDDVQVSGEIRALKIYKGSCGDSQFAPGAVFAPYIDATLDYCTDLLEEKELKCQFGVIIEEDVEWYDIGYFTVKKPSSNAYSTSFTAVGRISAKAGGTYVSALSYPATIQDMLDEISTQAGVNINASIFDTSGTIDKKPEGYTHREMLATIAGIFFGFVTEDNQGNIVFGKFSTENNLIETDGDRTTTLPTFTDLNTEITGIKVVAIKNNEQEENVEKIFAKGVVKIAVANDFMTQELFDANVDNILHFTYRPGNVTISMGDFRIEPFDCMKVVDVGGNPHYVPCMSIVHTFDGGITTEIVAPGIENEEGSSGVFKGPMTQVLERYKAEILSVEKLLAKTASVEHLEANLAKINTAVIGDLFAKSGVITDLKIVDGYVTGQLNGVKINADVITTGTLAVDRLLVTGKDSIVYQINADSSGLSAEELKDEVYQKYLNGTDIVANSITAAQINVEELFSTKITATDLHITGNSTFDGRLDGATGVFSGDLKAKTIDIFAGDDIKYTELFLDDYAIHLLCADENADGTGSDISIYKEYMFITSSEIFLSGKIYSEDSVYSSANLWFSYEDEEVSDRGVLTQWADGGNHYIVSLNSNKLNTGVGWAGSSTYSTTTTIRGRTCKVQNASGTSSLSDERLKKDFATMKNWEEFYQLLEPYAFRMKNGNSGRYHMGFKAQQVEEALLSTGLTTSDFAGLVKMKYVKDEDDAENTALYETLGIKEGDDEYSLIYTEFVALNTYIIQQLMNRVKTLEGIVLNTEVSGI